MYLKFTFLYFLASFEMIHASYLRKKEDIPGSCGANAGSCDDGFCCSQHGWCGLTDLYCGVGCQGDFGRCLPVPTASPTVSFSPTILPGSCGPNVGSCSDGLCCSQFGWCGLSDKYCDIGCQSDYGHCSNNQPNLAPTLNPVRSVPPTENPSNPTTNTPSFLPSEYPVFQPTTAPPAMQEPSESPTVNPTISPTVNPTVNPTISPTVNPPKPINPTTKPSSSAGSENILSSVAGFTYYYAWPEGIFAGIGPRSLSFIQTNNIIAFYDKNDPAGHFYYSKYANKYIQLSITCKGKDYSFPALVADTCSGQPCDTNSNPQTGYLVDIEYYTAMNIFGTTDCVEGNIQFSIDLSQPLAITNCGANIGACGGNQCCSAGNYCGYSTDYCGNGCQNEYGPCVKSLKSSPICGEGTGQSCSNGYCCSQYGYCGNTNLHCGPGCQSSYGICY